MLRAFDQWLLPYLTQKHRNIDQGGQLHVVIAVCDHFEPFHDTDLKGAMRAMDIWHELWPQLVRTMSDCSGIVPKHTFFYPIEQYHPEVLESLARLCRDTGSEVEVHLHHHNDTAEGLEKKLLDGISHLRSHGCLPADSSGAVRFGFIHGNWALDDSDPAGRNCGVADEIGVLRRLGCYADFTMPSAPHGSQTRMINSIYYARDTPARKSHNTGIAASAGLTGTLRNQSDMLLMVQGPLGLNWRRRKWGVIPRVENAELSGANPATACRLDLWTRLSPSPVNGPPWIFVKLHTHGGIPRNYNSILGNPMREFYQVVVDKINSLPGVTYYFATAREMVNMIHAAEDGKTGTPNEFRDYLFKRPA
jgi:hypothetical protein